LKLKKEIEKLRKSKGNRENGYGSSGLKRGKRKRGKEIFFKKNKK